VVKTEDDRPWEQPGQFRRDGEPHRGPFLSISTEVILSLAVFGLCIPPLALLCILLALVALFLVRADETEIDTGRMDPEGLPYLQAARTNARTALIVSVCGLACFGGLLLSTLR
jgi:hypothetical protein